MRFRFRLLPVMIFCAALLLTVRVGSIWHSVTADDTVRMAAGPGIQGSVASPAAAQTPPPIAGDDAPAEPGFEDPEFGGLEATGDGVPEGMTQAEVIEDDDIYSDIASLTPGELRLLHELAGRREQIESKERELAEREAVLQAAEQQLVQTQRQLESIREEIQGLVIQYDEEQEQEQVRLRSIYSAMKPKSAAEIFNDLDLDTLVGLLRGMSPRKVAPIIAAMDPERARLITRELAVAQDLPPIPN